MKAGIGALLYCLAAVAHAQAPPGTALEREFADGDAWTIEAPMEWRIGETDTVLVVPQGFVHDKASVPRALWSFFPKSGPYTRAAVIHDYLYWAQPCTREQSDNLLMIAMKESGVSWFRRTSVYRGRARRRRQCLEQQRRGTRAWTAAVQSVQRRARQRDLAAVARAACSAKAGATPSCRAPRTTAATAIHRTCLDRR